jgi:parallel beta-helix repeat protein
MGKTVLTTLIVMVITLVLFGCTTTTQRVIYVYADAPLGGDGTTWEKAYKYLQDALNEAIIDDEIWVAAGTYKPNTEIGGSGDRYKSFQMKNGVALYGGFAGNETDREQRDWQTNKTILSGDLNGDDIGFTNNSENSFHVVIGDKTDSSAVLDGFTITAGNANFDTWPDDGGGGMSNYEGSPIIKNYTFKGNSAFADGGGMRNWGNCRSLISNCTFIGNTSNQEGGGMMNGPGSSTTVTNCIFSGNSAGEDGGGMYNNKSNPMVTNCTFSGNSANLTGGGMYNVNSSTTTVTNCTFNGNSAVTAGGGMCNTRSNPLLNNCILWRDSALKDPEIHNSGSTPIVTYSDIAGGYTGTGNIDADPQFADIYLRLTAGSPCVDTGNNTSVPEGITRDLDANPRILNGIVDMGAYEFKE